LPVEARGRFVRLYFRNPDRLDQIGGLAEVEVWGLVPQPTPTATPNQATIEATLTGPNPTEDIDNPGPDPTEDTGDPEPEPTREMPPPTEDVNQPPVAVAGPDQHWEDHDGDGSFVISVDGSGSWDPDGSIVAYNWFLDGAWVAEGQYQDLFAPVGQHTFTLEVTDDDGVTASDEFVVTVEEATVALGTLHVLTVDGSAAALGGACYSLFPDQGDGYYDPRTELANVCDLSDGINDGTTTFYDVPSGAYVLVQSASRPGYAPAPDQRLWIEAGTDGYFVVVNFS
jgi:hypothetical protein